MFNAIERGTFIKACIRKPWYLPNLLIEIFFLASFRIKNSIKISIQKDIHKGLKQNPLWLKKIEDPNFNTQIELNFPLLNIDQHQNLENIQLTNVSYDDFEGELKKSRWSECLEYIFTDDVDLDKLSLIKTWIDHLPSKEDKSWDTYSCCERVSNLSLLLCINPQIKSFFNEEALTRFYCESGSWISRHLEYYGLERTNNHFLNNGRALVIAGVIIDHVPWINAGLDIFRKFGSKIFNPLGYLREGSSHYQFVVAGWLFDTIAFARLKVSLEEVDPIIRLAAKVGGATQKMSLAFMDMTTHIGDISPDLHPKLSLVRLQALHSEWLGISRNSDLDPEHHPEEWFMLNEKKGALVARCAFQWPTQFATHAHADLGSFIWRSEGQWILVDPGRIDYAQQGSEQILARSHNTIMLNGLPPVAESVLCVGNWLPSFYTSSQIKCEIKDESRLVISHNGFARMNPSILHTRTLELTNEGLDVTDDLQGIGGINAELIWNFSPDFIIGDSKKLARSDNLEVKISSLVFGGTVNHIDVGKYMFSKHYGDAQPSEKIIFHVEASLPCNIKTQFKVKRLSCVE